MIISKRDIERAFGLGYKHLDKKENLDLPETQALLNIITNFPWMVEAAGWGFDPVISELVMQRETLNKKISDRKDNM